MDIFSHALWGGAALGRKKRGDFLLAAAFSLLPDLLGEGIMFLLAMAARFNAPFFLDGCCGDE